MARNHLLPSLLSLGLALLLPLGCGGDPPAAEPGPAPVFSDPSRRKSASSEPARPGKPRQAGKASATPLLDENRAWTSTIERLRQEQRVSTATQARALLDRVPPREGPWTGVEEALFLEEKNKAVRLANEALRAHWARVDGFRALAVGYDTLEAWIRVKELVDEGRRRLDTLSVKPLQAVIEARIAVVRARHALEDRNPGQAARFISEARRAFAPVRGLEALEKRVEKAVKERDDKAFRLRSFQVLADKARRTAAGGGQADLEKAVALWKKAMAVAPDEERRCEARRAAQRLTYKLVEREVASKR